MSATLCGAFFRKHDALLAAPIAVVLLAAAALTGRMAAAETAARIARPGPAFGFAVFFAHAPRRTGRAG